MTAEECIDKIIDVLSRDITVSNVPEFHVDGSSTTMLWPNGKETIERLLEISNIVREYKKGIWPL